MNTNFPEIGWTEGMVGILQDDASLSFPDYPKLRVQLEVPNIPNEAERGSWEPRDGCAFASWPAGSEIEFSAFRNQGEWIVFSIYNRKRSSGATLPVLAKHVSGWEETFAENHFEARKF